jgi:hypothetical protein
MAIADDPKQWGSVSGDPTASKGDEHSLYDYHTLRSTLIWVIQNTSNASVARQCKHALETTPRDGARQ